MADALLSLENLFPFIRWREPASVTWGSSHMFACRVCMACEGLNIQSSHQWLTSAEATNHIHHHLPKDVLT